MRPPVWRALLCLLNCGVVLYQAAFDARHPLLWVLSYLCDAVFLIVLLQTALRRVNTVAPNCGNTLRRSSPLSTGVTTKRAILLELACILPLELVALAAGATYEVCALARLNRLLCIRQVSSVLVQAGSRLIIQPMRLHTIKFVILVTGSVHVMACLWAVSACPLGECQVTGSWLQRVETVMPGQDFAHETRRPAFYTMSVYWATSTLSSTGYGDLRGLTRGEKWFSVVVMLTGVVMFGFLFGGFASIFSNRDGPLARFLFKRKVLARAVARAKLSTDVQDRVTDYYDYMWTQRCENSGLQLLAELPRYLRRDIAVSFTEQMFRASCTLKECPLALIRRLALAVIPVVYLPGESVVERGQLAECMFFLHDGQLSVHDRENRLQVMLGPGKT